MYIYIYVYIYIYIRTCHVSIISPLPNQDLCHVSIISPLPNQDLCINISNISQVMNSSNVTPDNANFTKSVTETSPAKVNRV